jgi:hypothetical protein
MYTFCPAVRQTPASKKISPGSAPVAPWANVVGSTGTVAENSASKQASAGDSTSTTDRTHTGWPCHWHVRQRVVLPDGGDSGLWPCPDLAAGGAARTAGDRVVVSSSLQKVLQPPANLGLYLLGLWLRPGELCRGHGLGLQVQELACHLGSHLALQHQPLCRRRHRSFCPSEWTSRAR